MFALLSMPPDIKDGEKVIANVHMSPTSPSIPIAQIKTENRIYIADRFRSERRMPREVCKGEQ